MGDRVRPGDNLNKNISADLYNWLRRRRQEVEGFQFEGESQQTEESQIFEAGDNCIPMVNRATNSGRCFVVGFSSSLAPNPMDSDIAASCFKNNPILIAEDLTQNHIDCCRWGIIVRGSFQGCTIKVATSGNAVAQIEVKDPEHKYVRPVEGLSLIHI